MQLKLEIKRNQVYYPWFFFQKPDRRSVDFKNYKSFHELKKTLESLENEEEVTDYEAKSFLPKHFHKMIKLYDKYKSAREIMVCTQTFP